MPSPIHIRDSAKDSEARIRALTREVGTLREDLRRETKRRERSVAHIRQSDEAKSISDAKIKELQYTNKKLMAELAASHESQNIGNDRNRRALKSLREGLASVESAVAMRAQQGKALIYAAFECLTKLKQEIFDRGGHGSSVSWTASGEARGTGDFEVQVTVILAETMSILGQLEHLLLGASGGASDNAISQGAGPAHSLESASYQLERAALEEEVAHLRSQVIMLKASAEQASTAAAVAANTAASALSTAAEKDAMVHGALEEAKVAQSREQQAVEAMQLQQVRHEKDMLQSSVEDLTRRLQMQDKSIAQSQAFIQELKDMNSISEQHSSSLQSKLLDLQSELTRMGLEKASLQSQLQEQTRQSEEYVRQLRMLQGAVSAQQDDVQTALRLVSESRRDTKQAARKPLPAAPAAGSLHFPMTVPTPHTYKAMGPESRITSTNAWMPVSAALPGPSNLYAAPGNFASGSTWNLPGGIPRGKGHRSSQVPSSVQTPTTLRHTESKYTSHDAASTAALAARVAAAAVSASGGALRPQGPQVSQSWNNSFGEDLLKGLSNQQTVHKKGPSSLATSLATSQNRSSLQGFDQSMIKSPGPDASRQSDQLKEDMNDLDEEIQQLEAMLQRASRQIG